MITKPATVGARGADSLAFSENGTLAQAQALRGAGFDFFAGYLGAMTAARVQAVLGAGMAFMPVTFGGAFDGAAAALQCKALGLSAGCTVWLDVEGQTIWAMKPTDLIAKINAWADAVGAAGFMPGLYVGVPQPLTSAELWNLHVKRYWRGQGRVVDRTGALSEPQGCGWCMAQAYPSVARGGVLVDVDFIGQDYLQRVPNWVAA